MSVGVGIGIAALIFAVIGIFLPLIGLFVGWVALLIACLAALFGDRGLTIATVVVSVVAFLFFTPSLWLEAAASADTGNPAVFRIVSIVLVIAPVVCMFLFSTGKLVLGKPKVRPN